MRLIVGLGNSDRKYDGTRHNAGFMVVDELVRRFAPDQPVRARFHADCIDTTLDGHRCVLIKPATYMNRSGIAVGEALRFYKLGPSDLLVVTDDLYLDLGEIRLRSGGGSGGHNGLGDIARVLGAESFPRCRVGIGPKPPGSDQSRWVLARLSEDETHRLGPAVSRAADACEVFAARGIDAAMNRFNTRSSSRQSKPKAEQQQPGTPSRQSTERATNESAVHPGWLDSQTNTKSSNETNT